MRASLLKGWCWKQVFAFIFLFFFPFSDSADEVSIFLPSIPSLPPSSGFSCNSRKPDVQVTLQGRNQKMSWGMEEHEMLTQKKRSILSRWSACLLLAFELAGLPANSSLCHSRKGATISPLADKATGWVCWDWLEQQAEFSASSGAVAQQMYLASWG